MCGMERRKTHIYLGYRKYDRVMMYLVNGEWTKDVPACIKMVALTAI